jgi:hypothetical protein
MELPLAEARSADFPVSIRDFMIFDKKIGKIL